MASQPIDQHELSQVKYFGEFVKSKPLVQQMPFWERSAVLG